jgi:hypothetical protein
VNRFVDVLVGRRSALLVALATLAMIGAAFFLLAWTMAPNRHDDLWVEVGGAGLQTGVVVFLGAVVTAISAWLTTRRAKEQKSRDDDLAKERRRNEFGLRVFHDLIGGYNRVKAVRRSLRALGMRDPPHELNATQVTGLRTEMARLIDAQLSFEAVWRELNANAAEFQEPRPMLKYVGAVEEKLHAIVQEWEEGAGGIWAGSCGERIKGMRALQAFIGKRNEGFEDVSTSMRKVQALVRQQLVGRELEELEKERETDN